MVGGQSKREALWHSGYSALDYSGSNGPGLSPDQGTATCTRVRHFTLTVPFLDFKNGPVLSAGQNTELNISCVLRLGTLLSQCLPPPRSILNGYQ